MKSKFTVLITNLKFLSNINLPKGSTTKATNLVVSFSDLRASWGFDGGDAFLVFIIKWLKEDIIYAFRKGFKDS